MLQPRLDDDEGASHRNPMGSCRESPLMLEFWLPPPPPLPETPPPRLARIPLDKQLSLNRMLANMARLRQTCHHLKYQVDRLTRDRDQLHVQCQTVQWLFLQEKHDRNRLSRALTASQRELEFHKRNCSLDSREAGRRRSRTKRPSSAKRIVVSLAEEDEEPGKIEEVPICTEVRPQPEDLARESTVKVVRMCNEPRASFCGIFFDTTADTAGASGVRVKQVAPGSHAAQVGVRPGDRILEICGINMRHATHCLAEKVIRQCEEERIEMRISSTANNLTGPCRLVRRDAFKRTDQSYLDRWRRRREQLTANLLYQSCHLTVSMARRISVAPGRSLEKLRLLGGNSVGIFVHSTQRDEFLARVLRTGDQILEYNQVDLTRATAEDAAIQLATKPADASGQLVVLFNIDVYNQIGEKPGDSFYIRAEFSRHSFGGTLAFEKGDVLYVDNTMYHGRPGQFWSARKVDDFGCPTGQTGLIPSKYNADCELLFNGEIIGSPSSTGADGSRLFRWFRTLFSSSADGYRKLEENSAAAGNSTGRVLACAELPDEKRSDEDDSTRGLRSLHSYRMVELIEPRKPRPVILFGPYSHVIAQRLAKQFPDQFQVCAKITDTMIAMMAPNNTGTDSPPPSTEYIACTHSEFVPLKELDATVSAGRHPVIPVAGNCVEEFRRRQRLPVVLEIRFRSAKHIKQMVNHRWNLEHSLRISLKPARALYSHHVFKLKREFHGVRHLTVAIGNNQLTTVGSMIRQLVRLEQRKPIWCDHQ